MPKTSPKYLVLLLFAVATGALHADTYNYLINAGAANGDPASNFTAAGTFSGPVDPYNSAGIDITSITGSANGYDFLGVVDSGATNSQKPATEFGFTFDNVLFPSNGAAHTDPSGMLLYLSSPIGTSLAHVYYTGASEENPAGYVVDVIDPNEPGASTPFSVATSLGVRNFSVTRAATPSAVPEPSSYVLLGSGLAVMAGALRRKRFREDAS
jgi:hypothetical protein